MKTIIYLNLNYQADIEIGDIFEVDIISDDQLNLIKTSRRTDSSEEQVARAKEAL